VFRIFLNPNFIKLFKHYFSKNHNWYFRFMYKGVIIQIIQSLLLYKNKLFILILYNINNNITFIFTKKT